MDKCSKGNCFCRGRICSRGLLTGLVWYSQPMFGRAFIRLSGIRPGDIRAADKRRTGIVGVVTSILFALLIGVIHHHVDHSGHILFCSILFIWLFFHFGEGWWR